MGRREEGLRTVIQALKERQGPPCLVTAGFDGCVDAVLRPIRRRAGQETDYFSTIASFGAYLQTKAGLSCAVGVEPVSRRFGGNAPNLCAAVAALGGHASCVGNLGGPEPCFQAVGADLYTIGPAGVCDALQFSDGKVMLSSMRETEHITFRDVRDAVGAERLDALFQDSGGTAFVNWAEMPHAADIWQGIVDEVWARHGPDREKWLLIDLTDCSRRPAEELEEIAEVCAGAARYRRVVWSLNAGEGMQVARHFRCVRGSAAESAQRLRERLSADLLVIHDVEECALAAPEGAVRVAGVPVRNPRISVGGGDHFNGALLFALLHGLPPEAAAAFAAGYSAAFVARGRSPSLEEYAEFAGAEPD